MDDLNVSDINRFLKFLDSTTSWYTFVLFDGETTAPLPGYGTVFLTPVQLIALLRSQTNVTAHVTLNSTSDKGRKIKDIQAARVLCVDLDTITDKATIKSWRDEYQVNLIVESSPGKYHLYWKISPLITLPDWSVFQLGLATYFQGDTSLAQLHHAIRVPGVPRTTKDGQRFTPKIVFASPKAPELDRNAVLALFPWILNEYEKGIETAKTLKTQRHMLIKGQLKEPSGRQGEGLSGSPNNSIILTGSGRNVALYEFLANHASLLSAPAPTEEDLMQVAVEVNNSFAPEIGGPLTEQELQKTVKSAHSHGINYRERKLMLIKEHEEKILSALEELPIVANSSNGANSSEYVMGINNTNTKPPDNIERSDAKEASNSAGAEDGASNSSANNSADPTPPYPYDYSDPALALNRFTDAAVIARVIQRFGDKLVRIGKIVHAFDTRDKVWKSQKGSTELVNGYVETCLKDTIKDPEFIPTLCLDSKGNVVEAKIKAAQEKYQSNRILSHTVSNVLSNDRIKTRQLSDFDSHPYKFYAANGVLDLVTGKIVDARASDLMLNKSGVRYVPERGSGSGSAGTCEGWRRLVREIFAGSSDTQEGVDAMCLFIQCVFGYSLTGSIDAQKIFIHEGDGSNGKSKILEALALLTGSYCTRMSCSALAKGKHAVSTELNRIGAKLEGRRVIVLDDLDSKTVWNEGLIKNLTSPTIIARNLYEEEKDIPNRAKVHIGCNTVPIPESENFGILRRLCLIPYRVRFEPNMDKENEIIRMIRAESSGILNWAVEGFRHVWEAGFKLSYPKEVVSNVEDYRQENFNMEAIIEEMFEHPGEGATPEHWESIEVLAQEVNAQLQAKGFGHKSVTPISLGRMLVTHGFKMRREQCFKSRKRWYFVLKKYEKATQTLL